MIQLQQTHGPYNLAGLALLITGLCVFTFGLPPFQAGIWLQTEPTMVAIYGLGSLTAFWAVYGLIRKKLALTKLNILWKCLLLWVGWQWFVTLFIAPHAWRSWAGPVEIGEGAGWYTSLLLCIMLCSALIKHKRYAKITVASAIAAILVQAGLHWYHPYEYDEWQPWQPAKWPDYLAFMIAYLWIATGALGYIKHARFLLPLILVTYFTLYISLNMAGTLFVSLAMLTTVVFSYPKLPNTLRTFMAPSRSWRLLCIMACVLPLGWIVFSGSAHRMKLEEKGDITSTLADSADSMGARIMLLHIGLKTLVHEPSRLLAGKGWGNFNDDSYKYALVGSVHAFNNGELKPNAGQIYGSAFHTHSEPLEVLLSLGIPGLILWLAFPIIAIARLPAGVFWYTAPMIAAVILLYNLWFILPQVLAFQALAFAALCNVAAQKPAEANDIATMKVAPLIALATALLMAWTGHTQYEAMRYGDNIHFFPRENPATAYEGDWLKEEIKRGGDRLRVGGENFSIWGWRVHNKKEDGAYDKQWHRPFLDAAEIMAADSNVGVRNRMLHLWVQYKLLLDFTDEEHDELRTYATRNIEDSIMLLTRLAPHREDVAAPFLMNIRSYTKDNIAKQVEILVKMLNIHPNHRSALWLLGHIYLKEPGYTAVGADMLRRAAAMGVEKVYPVLDHELTPWLSSD